MAQSVTIAGASYPDVPSIEVPKTGGGTAVFYDASIATATADKIASGYTAFGATGLITGTGSGGGGGGFIQYTGIGGTATSISVPKSEIDAYPPTLVVESLDIGGLTLYTTFAGSGPPRWEFYTGTSSGETLRVEASVTGSGTPFVFTSFQVDTVEYFDLYEGDWVEITTIDTWTLKVYRSDGSGLSLDVVGGTTKPANPDENTIWVNTATEISGFCVRADAPSSPSQGLVWIVTRNGTKTSLSVSDDYDVMLYPAGVKQYVSNAWVWKDAEIYQGSSWSDIVFWTYNAGEEFSTLTGGWKIVNGSHGTGVKNADNFYLGYTSTSGRTAVAYTNDTIDVTGFSKMKVDYQITSVGSNTSNIAMFFGLSTDNTSNSATAGWATNTTQTGVTARTIKTIDISSLSGSYYIKVCASVVNGNIYNVWLEE